MNILPIYIANTLIKAMMELIYPENYIKKIKFVCESDNR